MSTRVPLRIFGFVLFAASVILSGCGETELRRWDCEAVAHDVAELRKAVAPILEDRAPSISSMNDCYSGGGGWLHIELPPETSVASVLADFKKNAWVDARTSDVRGYLPDGGRGAKKRFGELSIVVALEKESPGQKLLGKAFYID
ncbi:hypothetical protein SAMN05421505_10392 [Sinosporangium album]|uniref:Uncharacterized protein n=1 Tax=Sinosporangium album TaxID=504805 RepID=A0A1G7T3P9_9ACTN|nr:hypothetical protein SAMN05421505_10392 [Sinosporangium album]